MELDFTLPVSGGIAAGIIVVGLLGMWQAQMMTEDTLFTMVLPSMVVFAAINFVLGVKYGEYRAAGP